MEHVLEAQSREGFTKSGNKKLRRQGKIPAVVYGKDIENRSLYVDHSDFIKVIREAGRNGVIRLKVNGSDFPVMMYDAQIDRIKDEIVHLDFYKIDMKKEVDADVTVHLQGEAQGVKDGGVLQHLLHEVTVRALPADIPEAIEADISALEIGDSLTVNDLKNHSKYEILNDPEEVIVSITPPTKTVTEETEEEREPELVEGEENENDENEEKAE